MIWFSSSSDGTIRGREQASPAPSFFFNHISLNKLGENLKKNGCKALGAVRV